MKPVTLFGLEISVYTRIARLALEEKDIPYTFHEVEIFGPNGVPAEHLVRHPFGRIPVLQHGAFSLYETAAITRYVDEAFPGPCLQPREPETRARMNQLIGVLDSYAYRPMVWGVFVQWVRIQKSGDTPNEQEASSALATSEKCLVALEQFTRPGAFLVGEQISLADLHAFPILRYLSLAPEGLALLSKYPLLNSWLRSMLLRQSVLRTGSPYEAEK
ncbi:MAG TPA: glutathione S-transferase family protein [Steroidobacteraceae bacterium]|nr:glutathione S-transferase family protein [Steroidobacteraceae bacterium]